jgi:hypothetical protein
MLVRDRNYLYDGTNESMNELQHRLSPLATGAFENGERDWDPSPAPVNITFAQASAFGGSGFPGGQAGPRVRHALGLDARLRPSRRGRLIQEWVINPDGTRRVSAGSGAAQPAAAWWPTRARATPPPPPSPRAPRHLFQHALPGNQRRPAAPGAKILRVVYTADRRSRGCPGAGPGTSRGRARSGEDPVGTTVTQPHSRSRGRRHLFSDDAAALRKLREDGAHSLLDPAFSGRS